MKTLPGHPRFCGLVTAAVLVGLLGGCQEPLPELRYETPHLHVGTAFEEPLCAGDLAHYEQVLTAIEEQLDVRVEEPIEIYIWDFLSNGNPGWCESEVALGCYADGVVYTSIGSEDHELVHAVIHSFASPPRFWDEGAAEALETNRTRFGQETPVDSIDGPDEYISYNTAGHFSRWLIETFGIEGFRTLLRAPGSAREAFEQTYELSVEQAQAQYLEDTPDSYAAGTLVPATPLVELAPDHWRESILIDCAREDTFGGPHGIRAQRGFTVTERGDYAIEVSGDGASLRRVANEDYEVTPSLDEPELYGDVPAYTEVWVEGYRRSLPAGTTILDLTPGDYELGVGFLSHQTGTVEVEIARVDDGG